MVANISRLLKPRMTATAPASKRTILEFTESVGMVYFGFVSQRDDEHHIVRGLTVSNQHHDDHYCIGTIDEYDTVFVERSDTLKNGKKHVWHIMEFDLKSSADVPHVFIGSEKKGHAFHELLELKYPSLTPLTLGATAGYPESFTKQYGVYTTPAHAVEVERLLPPDIAATIASHFKGLVIEITEQALYVYSEAPHATVSLLQTMAKNGAWLAAAIDTNNRPQ